METSAIQPVSPQLRVTDPNHALRVNQRISAEILKVAADHVVLALDGFPVIAQLTSSDQSAELAERKTAQFIVRDTSGKQLLLQLAPGGPAQGSSNTSESALISKLLSHFGIPLDDANLILAQQLLEAGLPITQPGLAALRKLLDQTGPWGERQAQTAVQLQKAGIPLSPAVLQLALAHHPGTIPALQELLIKLQLLQGARLPAETQSNLQQVIQFLSQALHGNSANPADAAGIASYISSLGSPLENHLLKMISQPEALQNDQLLQIATLRTQLQQTGYSSLAEVLDTALNELQYQSLNNISNPGQTPQEGNWFTVDLPYPSPPGSGSEQAFTRPAQLRIAYKHDAEHPEVDPHNTHIRLQVPVDDYRSLEFDLIIHGSSIATRVHAPDEMLQVLAEQELPSLQDGLEALGFSIQRAECLLAEVQPVESQSTDPRSRWLDSGINMEA